MMVAPGAGYRGVYRFSEDQKKGLRRKITGFSVHMRLETKQNEKQGLHHKSVELWFQILISCHLGRAAPPPSYATGLALG